MSKLWPSRRTFLRMSPMVASFAIATCSRRTANSSLQTNQAPAQSQELPPTPACGEDEPTLSQTSGPFHTPNSPERQSLLEPNTVGTRIVLIGQVLSSSCQPVANALVDFWHTNDQGEYDNRGYTLRGHQFTDVEGFYQLETIVPGIYPGRTRHFHVKVQATNQPVLTTQLYFPEEPLNQRDQLFQPDLLMTIVDSDDGKQATFNFVLEMG